VASTPDHAGHDQYRATLDSCRNRRCGVGWALLGVISARDRFGHLLPDHSLDHSLVAADLEQAHEQRLRTLVCGKVMKHVITGFEKDDENHWRAILDCGHRQHVRHDPPLTTRTWVLTEEGRASRLGFELDCKRCDEEVDATVDRDD
jgi:hypothetical protein